eukprot:CAMPEP_0177585958 /NCGR_PEP_ID=MMETSP0419_2-20121207/4795_1 /TAXON_ID=582737 /ORGANISM="Tetraselmis sp., Strain GSL018" /LENGTH=192 /DNA_ID=CAMNT_0019075775 /DNA_START=52 /DNA_END=630 /DNA_ORIENTATION=+
MRRQSNDSSLEVAVTSEDALEESAAAQNSYQRSDCLPLSSSQLGSGLKIPSTSPLWKAALGLVICIAAYGGYRLGVSSSTGTRAEHRRINITEWALSKLIEASSSKNGVWQFANWRKSRANITKQNRRQAYRTFSKYSSSAKARRGRLPAFPAHSELRAAPEAWPPRQEGPLPGCGLAEGLNSSALLDTVHR